MNNTIIKYPAYQEVGGEIITIVINSLTNKQDFSYYILQGRERCLKLRKLNEPSYIEEKSQCPSDHRVISSQLTIVLLTLPASNVTLIGVK